MSETNRTSDILVSPKPPPDMGGVPQDGRPDVIIQKDGRRTRCWIDDEHLEAVRERARAKLRESMKDGYEHFPIDQNKLLAKTIDTMFTSNTICRAFGNSSRANEHNHNDIRERYKSRRLSPADGLGRGVVADRIPPETNCPEDYDWKDSPFYNGVSGCEDIIDEIGSNGMPTAMYSAPMTAAEALDVLEDPANAPLYTWYANEGPIECKSGPGYEETFSIVRVTRFWPSMEFATRNFSGDGWSSWALRRSCESPDGTIHEAGDMMFNFGVRVFVPVDASVKGSRKEHALVMTQMAAAGSNPLAKYLPKSLPYQRFIGGEFAKKVLLEAKAHGWGLTQKALTFKECE